MPERIQRQRTFGWRKPKGSVYVGRPTVWANPYRTRDVEHMHDEQARRHFVVLQYRHLIADMPVFLDRVRRELAGKDLLCWCPLPAPGEPDLCHAAVLLEIANSDRAAGRQRALSRGGDGRGDGVLPPSSVDDLASALPPSLEVGDG